MKKFLVLICSVFFFLGTVAFSACSSDKDEEVASNDLVGTWYEDRAPGDEEEVFHITFKANGEFTFWVTWPNKATETTTGHYDVAGSTLTEIVDGQKPINEEFHIINGKLYIGEIVYHRV